MAKDPRAYFWQVVDGALPPPRVAATLGIEFGAIDADAGTIELEVDAAELERRRQDWKPRRTNYQTGAIRKFVQGVGPAHLGAVTHPGGAAETHMYADI